jgi:regulatory protein
VLPKYVITRITTIVGSVVSLLDPTYRLDLDTKKQEVMNMLETTVDFSDIKNKAIELLARREHARGELKTKLLKRFTDSTLIDEVLETLQKANLQSDDRFTEAYITYRQNAGFGPFRIKQELKERGVSKDLISTYLNPNDDTWQQNARDIINRKYTHPFTELDYDQKAKALRFLQSRGFDTSHF